VETGQLRATLLRFWAGTAGSILLGVAAPFIRVLQAGSPAFQCVTVGALAAGILALVRAKRAGQALILVGAFALVQFGLHWATGIVPAVVMVCWSLFIGGGLFLVAVVFDRVADMGYRFGKFLLAGSMLGGIYLAATPLAGMAGGSGGQVLRSLWWNTYLGIVIGDGVGLGVELIELLPIEPAKRILRTKGL
jgi:hypothetical protein